MRPMFPEHLTQVTRDLQEVVHDGKSVLSKFPEDFVLYQLGTWEESTGKFDLLEKEQHILNISELIMKPQQGENHDQNKASRNNIPA